jgi:hypothetical protein
MAVQISGIQIKWGIPSALKTSADALVLGIVQNISLNRAGSVENIPDEDGDFVTRVDHGKHNTGTITTMMVTPGSGSPAIPAKGAEITGLGAIDGVALNVGKVFVDDASITYSGTAGTQVTIPFTHYPDM